LLHFDPRLTKTSHIIRRYAVRPAKDCDGLIIPEYEADNKKLYFEQSRKLVFAMRGLPASLQNR